MPAKDCAFQNKGKAVSRLAMVAPLFVDGKPATRDAIARAIALSRKPLDDILRRWVRDYVLVRLPDGSYLPGPSWRNRAVAVGEQDNSGCELVCKTLYKQYDYMSDHEIARLLKLPCGADGMPTSASRAEAIRRAYVWGRDEWVVVLSSKKVVLGPAYVRKLRRDATE